MTGTQGFPSVTREQRAWTLIAFMLVALASPRVVQGQRKLVVSPKFGLRFGSMFPGLAMTVLPNDAARSAALDIVGPNRAQVQIVFTLPTSMSGPAGSSIPLTFTATSGGFSESGAIGGQVAFDPRVSYLNFLSNTGRATIYLGGVATPSSGQRSGAYSGTIVMTVSLTGL